MKKTLDAELQRLASLGCYPCLSLRGFVHGMPVWRAHVNGAGAFWAEASRPLDALRAAVTAWTNMRCPKDGYASVPRARP